MIKKEQVLKAKIKLTRRRIAVVVAHLMYADGFLNKKYTELTSEN